MSFQSYVDNLMADGSCQDAAIVGYTDVKYIWAAHAGGTFNNITPEEINVIIGSDRSTFLTNGLTLGSKKCSVIKDQLFDDSYRTMDLRMKIEGEEGMHFITVARANKALVLVMGKSGTNGGDVNKKADKMADYLKTSGY